MRRGSIVTISDALGGGVGHFGYLAPLEKLRKVSETFEKHKFFVEITKKMIEITVVGIYWRLLHWGDWKVFKGAIYV